MKTIRIFISSPGDVAEERERARQVVEGLRRRYAGRLLLKPVLWEDLPLQADMSFQQGIDLVLSAEHGLDIGVFILWARLGSLQDGSKHRSGTEREFDLMLEARRQSGGVRPSLLVYTRSDDASFGERLRGKSTAEQQALIHQKAMAEQFITEKFQDATTGRNLRAHHSFDRPVTFSQRLGVHLTELLDELAGGGLPEAVWDIAQQGPPFRGLEAFEPQHADVFFGRETETLEARHALREQARNGCAFLLLSGASGSGKSSLARAGVLPAIVENELDEHVVAWRRVIATPLELGADPLAGLVRRLAADDVLPDLRGDADAMDDFIEGMRRDPVLALRLRFKDALARAAKRQNGGVRVLLVLDQLEELFATTIATDSARSEFLHAVEAMACSGNVWVLATVRSDFWGEIQDQPALVRMTEARGVLPVLPPTADALRRLIEEPARLAGLSFEQRDGQSLASRILRDAAPHAELLPLLEYVLRELFEQRTSERVLTWGAYEQLGGVEGALAKRAEDVFKALPGDAQEALGAVLKALVTIGHDGGEGSNDQVVRQRVPVAHLAMSAGAAALMKAFVEERLLTTASDPETGEAVVTIAHESLLRVWPRAVAWAEQNVDFLRTRARIAARMKEGSPLLEGDPLLDAARHYLAAQVQGFTRELREFVTESVRAATAQQHRRTKIRRRVTVGLSALTATAVAAAVLAIIQTKHASAEKLRAESAQEHAEALASTMLVDLKEKLVPLGKIDLLEDISRSVEDYYSTYTAPSLGERTLNNRAMALTTRGQILGKQGKMEEARTAFRSAAEIRRQLLAADPKDTGSKLALITLNDSILVGIKDHAQRQAAVNDALRELEAIAAAEPTNVNAQSLLAHFVESAARLEVESHAWPKAEELYKRAIAIHKTLAAREPADESSQEALVDVLTARGKAVLRELQWAVSNRVRPPDESIFKAAIDSMTEAATICEAVIKAKPDHAQFQRKMAEIHDAMYRLLKMGGEKADAAEQLAKAIRIKEKLSAADPSNSLAAIDLATACNKMGLDRVEEKDFAEADDYFLQAVKKLLPFRSTNADNLVFQQTLCTAYSALAFSEERERRFASAHDFLEAAVKVQIQIGSLSPSSKSQRDLAEHYARLGATGIAAKRTKPGLDAYRNCIAIVEKLKEEKPADSRLDELLSNAYLAIGKNSGDDKDALLAFTRSAEISRGLAERSPDDASSQLRLLGSLQELEVATRKKGDVTNAQRTVVEFFETAGRLERMQTKDAKALKGLAEAWERRGFVAEDAGDLKAARQAYEKRMEALRRVAQAHPADVQACRDLSWAYNKLGDVERAKGDLKAARTFYESSIAGLKPLADADPGSDGARRDLHVSYGDVAYLSLREGNLKGAKAAFEQCLAISRRLAKAHQNDTDVQGAVGFGYGGLGDVAIAEGDLVSARNNFEKALSIRERLANEHPKDVDIQRAYAGELKRMADLNAKERNYPECAKHMEREIAVLQTLGDVASVRVSYLNLSWCLLVAKDFSGSQAAAEKGIALDPNYIPLYTNFAHSLLFQGKTAEAAAVYGKHKESKVAGKPWPEIIAADFKELRKEKLDHPGMKEIEALLSVAPGKER